MSHAILLEPDALIARPIARLLAAMGHQVTRPATVCAAALDAFMDETALVVASTSTGLSDLAELNAVARRRSPRVECIVYGPGIDERKRGLWRKTGASRVLDTFGLIEELLARLGSPPPVGRRARVH